VSDDADVTSELVRSSVYKFCTNETRPNAVMKFKKASQVG